VGEDGTACHADEQKEHEAAIGRLQGEYDRLRHRLHAMYVDKLDGRIDGSFYTQMSEQWRTEQDKIAQEIARHQAADRSCLEEGAQLIELAHGAQTRSPGTATASEFRTIELDLERWRAHRDVPATL
jgi:hypothetical protein